MWLFDYFFLNSSKLICPGGTDISKLSESPLDFKITGVNCILNYCINPKYLDSLISYHTSPEFDVHFTIC